MSVRVRMSELMRICQIARELGFVFVFAWIHSCKQINGKSALDVYKLPSFAITPITANIMAVAIKATETFFSNRTIMAEATKTIISAATVDEASFSTFTLERKTSASTITIYASGHECKRYHGSKLLSQQGNHNLFAGKKGQRRI